jgi:preprotein translocase subunit SecF
MSAITRLYRGENRIEFIGHRKRWYLGSAILLLICVLAITIRGFNYGIEFAGGAQFQIPVANTAVSTSEVNAAFQRAGVSSAEAAQVVGSGSTRQIRVRTASLTPAEQQKVTTEVAKDVSVDATKISVLSVSSAWGHDITVKALQGLIVFLIAVSIYISLRFQWRMAVGGILALLNDLVIAAGVYALVGFEVTPSTVVGLLTILGFSLYDTVVVYDKVAENTRDILAGSRATYSEAANLAVNQTLMRSINTSLIALLPVAGLLFVGVGLLGVGTLKDLALILFVGLASGAYSSLFLATPIVVDLTEREPAYKQLRKRVAAKRSSDVARAAAAADAALATAGASPRANSGTAAAPPRRTGSPMPAPRPGARPQRQRRK